MTTDNNIAVPVSIEFRKAMMGAWFKGEPTPETLAIGLSSAGVADNEDRSVTLAQLEAAEVKADDYTRRILLASDWVVEDEDGMAVAKNDRVGFVHTGTTRWPGVRTAFITDSAAPGGMLISWAAIPFGPKVLAPGDTLEAEFQIRW